MWWLPIPSLCGWMSIGCHNMAAAIPSQHDVYDKAYGCRNEKEMGWNHDDLAGIGEDVF